MDQWEWWVPVTTLFIIWQWLSLLQCVPPVRVLDAAVVVGLDG